MKMNKLNVILILLCLSWTFSALAKETKNQTPEMMLEGIDAKKAVALANDWHWTQKEIQTYITTREVAFKFPSGKLIQIPLPKNEVMVSIAPYINYTHT